MFFPICIPIEDRPVLVVGAGQVARHKVEKLLPFRPKLKVIAREALPEFKQMQKQGLLQLELRDFQLVDLDQFEIVIMATDDVELQKKTHQVCQQRGILFNAVDGTEYSTMTFPAMIQRKNFMIAISTGGKAPFMAATIKKWVDAMLPIELDEVIEKIEKFRHSDEIRALETSKMRGSRIINYSKALINELITKVRDRETPPTPFWEKTNQNAAENPPPRQ